MDLVKLRDAIVQAFATPEALETWVGTRISGVNIHNIFTGGTLDARAYQLLQWAESQGRTPEVLQALADHPPNGDTRLANAIYVATEAAIRPTASLQTGIPPVDPVKDWFVTKRPFANRAPLRTALATFDTAQAGSDSVLVIEGEHFSGKSYSVRFAKRVAPQDRFMEVDPAEWGEVRMTVDDVAAILTSTTDQPRRVDLTKEDEAVPRLLEQVKQKLKGSGTWIIADHCKRANLTGAAESLLLKLADAIEKGSLPGVRLILADIDRVKLSPALKNGSRYDRADLPNRVAVREWCQTLAAHMGKACSESVLDEIVNDVFQGLGDPPKREALVDLLEDRLSEAFTRIARC